MYLNKLIKEICIKKRTVAKKFPQNIFQTNEYIFSFKVNSENFSPEEENSETCYEEKGFFWKRGQAQSTTE